MKDNKIKFNEDSILEIRRVIGEEDILTPSGVKRVIKTEWVVSDKEVNLGSFKNPNKEIIEFRYKFPKEENNFFGGIFKRE